MNQQGNEKNMQSMFNPDYAMMLGKEATNAAILVPFVSLMIEMFRNKTLDPSALKNLMFLACLVIIARQTVEKTGGILDKIHFDKFYYLKYMMLRMRYGLKAFIITSQVGDQKNTSSGNSNNIKKYFYHASNDEKVKINDSQLQLMLQSKFGVNLSVDHGSYYGAVDYNIVACVQNSADFLTIYIPNHYSFTDSFMEKHLNKMIINSENSVDFFHMSLKSKTASFVVEHKLPSDKKQFVYMNNVYSKIINIINTNVDVNDTINTMQNAGLFWLYSDAGLGKSFFSQAYSKMKNCKFTTIVNVKLESLSRQSLVEIFNTIESNSWPGKGQVDSNGKPFILTLFLTLDEYDKYVIMYCEFCVEKEMEEMMKVNKGGGDSSGRSREKESGGNTTNINITIEKMTELEKEAIRIKARNECCKALKGLWDGNFMPTFKRITTMIISNEVESVYKDVDPNLVKVTKDRISPYTIKCLKAKETGSFLKAYVKHTNEYSNPKITIDLTEEHIRAIEQLDVEMSYRTLSKLICEADNSIDKLIEILKNKDRMSSVMDLSAD